METVNIVKETPKLIINLLIEESISDSCTEERLQNIFSRLSGMTISEFHASQAFHLVFDWHEFVDCSTKSVWHDIIKPMFEHMGCKIVCNSDYENI